MPKTILVPFDGSTGARLAMQSAVELAARLDATLVGLVLETYSAQGASGYSAGGAIRSARRGHEAFLRRAEALLSTFELIARARGVEFCGFHAHGLAPDASIAEAARRLACDAIVVTTIASNRAPASLRQVRVRDVLRLAAVPLIVVRAGRPPPIASRAALAVDQTIARPHR